MTTVAHTSGSTDTYHYDANGSMDSRTVAGASSTYTWNPQNQLIAVTAGANTTAFVYDAAGNRLMRKTAGDTVLYLPGQDPYTYSLNNPTSFTDPSGLFSLGGAFSGALSQAWSGAKSGVSDFGTGALHMVTDPVKDLNDTWIRNDKAYAQGHEGLWTCLRNDGFEIVKVQ